MDPLRDMCINQGYVSKTCTMTGELIFALVNSHEDPCKGCNENRIICKGRKKEIIKINDESTM